MSDHSFLQRKGEELIEHSFSSRMKLNCKHILTPQEIRAFSKANKFNSVQDYSAKKGD
jgi:hypothetical protein